MIVGPHQMTDEEISKREVAREFYRRAIRARNMSILGFALSMFSLGFVLWANGLRFWIW